MNFNLFSLFNDSKMTIDYPWMRFWKCFTFIFSAMTLANVGEPENAKSISEIGSMLFTRGVSGTRVVTGRDTKVIEGYTFKGNYILHKAKKKVFVSVINSNPEFSIFKLRFEFFLNPKPKFRWVKIQNF